MRWRTWPWWRSSRSVVQAEIVGDLADDLSLALLGRPDGPGLPVPGIALMDIALGDVAPGRIGGG
jgi:hypothetical protein